MTAVPQDNKNPNVSSQVNNSTPEYNIDAMQSEFVPTPKADDITIYRHFSFGTKGAGATGMNIFFSDGNRSISMTPAKYNTVLKEIDSARSQVSDSVIVSIETNKRNLGFSNKYTSKYAKVALSDKRTIVNPKMKEPRVLICEYVFTTTEFNSYSLESSFGIYVPLSEFEGIKGSIFGNPHAIRNQKNIDW